MTMKQPHMLPADLQETNERRFSRTHINGYIIEHIQQTPSLQEKVAQGVELLSLWLQGEYYESKTARLAQLKSLDLHQLVQDIFVGVAYYQRPELFVSVTSQLAARLGFSNHRDAILTTAEITAVLCETDAFDIIKESPQASMMLVSRMALPQALIDAIERSLYIPPMVSKPAEITGNYESPYLTYNDCQILGRGNGHAGDICLDVLNTQNAVELELDVEFLSTVEEVPNHELDSLEKHRQWEQFKNESYALYSLLVKQGNSFWLTHKVDKRGRIYAQGYHVTSQGTAFKKAMLELKNKETVEGVPS